MKHFNIRLFLYGFFFSLTLISCKRATNCNETKTNNNIYGIWCSDDYPDSIIAKKDIFNNSKWYSEDAFCIQIKKDSCYFTGWLGSLNKKFTKIGETIYRTTNEAQYWEFKIISDKKLAMRLVKNYDNKITYEEFYNYHKVDKLLTIDSIKNKIAEKVFIGTYKPFFNKSLECDSIVKFLKNDVVIGIKNNNRWGIEVKMDPDLFVPNAFKLGNNGDLRNFSFKFKNDTLILLDCEMKRDSSGMYEGIQPTSESEIFIRIK